MRFTYPRSRKKQILYGSLILPLAAVGVYFAVIRPIRIHQEKKQFEHVASQLEGVQAQIEAKIGAPDQKNEIKSCGYASVTYGRGRRSCGTTISMLYDHSDSTSSNAKIQNLKALFTGPIYDSSGRADRLFIPYVDNRPNGITVADQYLSQSLLNIHNNCRVEYTYPALYKDAEANVTLASERLRIDLICSSEALAEYYPLHK